MIAIPDSVIKMVLAYLQDVNTATARQLIEDIQREARPAHEPEQAAKMREVK